jgi:hypothetical protein
MFEGKLHLHLTLKFARRRAFRWKNWGPFLVEGVVLLLVIRHDQCIRECWAR